MSLNAPASDSHPQRGKIGYFLALSVLVHLLLMLPPAPPRETLFVPAPDLSVSNLTIRRSAPALDAIQKINRVAENAVTPPDTARQTNAHENESPALPDETAVNNLHSLLRAELNKHFIYPPAARRNGWEGRVDVAVRLNHEGRLDALRIVHSSGYAILDQDALMTLEKIGIIPQARSWLRGYSYDTQLPVLYRLTEG